MPLTMEETEFCGGSFSPLPFFPYKTRSTASLRPMEIFKRNMLYFLGQIYSSVAATLVVLFYAGMKNADCILCINTKW